MNKVQPIRNKDVISNILSYLRNTNERNYILFMLGIYTGLRISDIRRLKVGDVRSKQGVNIKSKKTGKMIFIKFNVELKRALDKYIKGKDDNDYILKSREGYNSPITRQQAYKILRKIADKFDLQSIGTHSLRKTFGYHYYYACKKDIVKVQMALDHSDPSITLRYIGILQEDVEAGIDKLKF